jgi:hypothetical protein
MQLEHVLRKAEVRSYTSLCGRRCTSVHVGALYNKNLSKRRIKNQCACNIRAKLEEAI